MAARSSKEAIAWGRSRIAIATAPTSTGNWFRWCKVFVRMCFNVPSDGTPDAGQAWDRAKFKHHESDPMQIPAGVPVFWELASVADHIALSTGRGRCLSNDILRSGRIDEVAIDTITRSWGGRLLGWTEDIDSVRVWQPKPEAKETGNITAALQADNVADREAALRRVVRHGAPEAQKVAQSWLDAIENHQQVHERMRGLRKRLRKLEVKR